MTTPINERDDINLNAYLDGEMADEERRAFEARLADDPALQQELDATRTTIALLGMAEPVRAPRNFTLDPAVYGQPERLSFWDRLGLPLRVLAPAGAAIAATLLCVAGVILFSQGTFGLGGAAAPEAAMQSEPAADMAQEAAEESAGEAEAFAPEEEPAEQPAEEPEAEMMVEVSPEAEEEAAAAAAVEEEAPEAEIAEAPAEEPAAPDTDDAAAGEPADGAEPSATPAPAGTPAPEVGAADVERSAPPEQDEAAELASPADEQPGPVDDAPRAPRTLLIVFAVVALVGALGLGIGLTLLRRRT